MAFRIVDAVPEENVLVAQLVVESDGATLVITQGSTSTPVFRLSNKGQAETLITNIKKIGFQVVREDSIKREEDRNSALLDESHVP